MMRFHPSWFGAAALIFLPDPAFAGPCAGEIHDLQVLLNARLSAIAAHGKAARQSTFAQLHRQPTPSSIASAEAQVGDISDADLKTIQQFMVQAHAADDRGDLAACHKALADARTMLKL